MKDHLAFGPRPVVAELPSKFGLPLGSASPATPEAPPSPFLQPAPALPMNPRTKRLLIIVLALDTLVVAGVVLYFMLRR